MLNKSLKTIASFVIICAALTFGAADNAEASKSGTFMNPITDVAYNEIFPIKIAGIKLALYDNYDAPDAAGAPICFCPIPFPPFVRPGISFSMWEPARVMEIVKDPFYFPMLGAGIDIGFNPGYLSGANNASGQGGGQAAKSTFYQAHWWIFPPWAILELLLDFACLEASGIDVGYLTEIDPLWNSDLLSAIITPESFLFGNPFAQAACVADAVSSNIGNGFPLFPLFWCIGSEAVTYPMTGRSGNREIAEASFEVAQKMIYKMGRMLLLCDPGIWLCSCVPTPIWVKSNYKMHEVRPIRELKAKPTGRAGLLWASGANPPVKSGLGPSDNFLWMTFRKRACCMF